MRSRFLSSVTLAWLFCLAGFAAAQDAAPAPSTGPAPGPVQVEGIADNDLLNVRASASPTGKVVARLTNGAQLRNRGCSEARGALWCSIESVDDPKLKGWVAARYLIQSLADDGQAAALSEGATDPALASAAGEQDTAAGEDQSPSVDVLTGEQVASGEPASTGTAQASGFDATGAIPCARYYGQPMGQCVAGVKRIGQGEATVTVTWPDGGQRVILFTNGRADNSDAPDPLSYTREADLNMIRIGKAERFEIPDALAFEAPQP